MPGPTQGYASTERAAEPLTGPPRSYGAIVWGQLRKRPGAMISLGVIVLIGAAGVFAPFLGGGVPIRWVEDGRITWPIFGHLSNLEYGVFLAIGLAGLLPLTARLLRRRTLGGEPPSYRRAVGLHVAVWIGFMVVLGLARGERPPPGDYLDRRDQAESAWFPPIAYPRTPGFEELGNREMPPSPEHPLGTGRKGDDVFINILYGARTAMTIGFVTVGIGVTIGVVLGSLSAYVGRWLDLVLMRVAEIFMCIPRLILIIIILAVIPPEWSPLWTVVVVLGITGWTGSFRMMRAQVLQIRTADYITAARATGTPTWWILVRHTVPNGMAPILVGATFGIAGAVFLEVTLAFLGLVQTPSWGVMLNDGRQHLEYWWLWGSAGAAIFVTVLAYNLLGEAVRDAIDPRLKI